MNARRQIAVIALIAFIAALAGVLVGRSLIGTAPARHGTDLHALLHHDMTLEPAQQAQLDALERGYDAQSRALEADLRADNAHLADAIAAEHGYGPRVSAAIDQCHQDMGRLQKATLSHVFAMRQILRPDQQHGFDRAVTAALVAGDR